MLRRALTPRWLLSALVLIAFTVAAIFLGMWQWDRTQTILASERAALEAPVALSELVTTTEASAVVSNDAIGRKVFVTGTYEPALQSAVIHRELDGQRGVWLVTGLKQDSGQITAVVRGWVPETDDAAAAIPAGPVKVTGVLTPSESFYADAKNEPGTVAAIDSARLSKDWGVPLTPGYVMLATQEPTAVPAPTPVPPTVTTGDVPFPLQNFFYAFQWWVFAVFGWVVYFRWLWLDAHRAHPST